MTEIHHEAVRVYAKAFQAGFTMPAVLRKAGVGRSTWWRIRKGEDFRASVIRRIDQAIDDMIKEGTK
jgi:predicted transcriptional regulator